MSVLLRNCLTGSCLCVLGDACAQKITRPESKLDFNRSRRFLLWGVAWQGLTMTAWYRFLDSKRFFSLTQRIVPRICHHTVATRVTTDIFTTCGVAMTIGFPAVHGFMEGKGSQEIILKIRRMGPEIFALNCIYWIPVSAFNFMVVPPWFRVFYYQNASGFFTLLMSLLNERHNHGERFKVKNFSVFTRPNLRLLH